MVVPHQPQVFLSDVPATPDFPIAPDLLAFWLQFPVKHEHFYQHDRFSEKGATCYASDELTL